MSGLRNHPPYRSIPDNLTAARSPCPGGPTMFQVQDSVNFLPFGLAEIFSGESQTPVIKGLTGTWGEAI